MEELAVDADVVAGGVVAGAELLMTVPLTWTRPSRMISSALRRLAMPACGENFLQAVAFGSSLFDSEAWGWRTSSCVAGFLTAEVLVAVGGACISVRAVGRYTG